MKPLLKYPGGKEKELNIIFSNIPSKIQKYYEPFIGGGASYFAMPKLQRYLINDKSEDLIYFYKMVKTQNKDFLFILDNINNSWLTISDFVKKDKKEYLELFNSSNSIFTQNLNSLISKININIFIPKPFVSDVNIFTSLLTKSLTQKFTLIHKLENQLHHSLSEADILDNIICAFKSAYYTFLRSIYNKSLFTPLRAVLFFFLREYCYSSMFRFNSKGEFNVPYGGISYNEKYLTNKINRIKNKEYINLLNNTIIENLDFYDFMKKYPPKKDDFIFLDPPYDTEFSTYDNNIFNQNDQKRLADYLINHCSGNWMLIIKNTDFILSLYKDGVKCANGNKLKIFTFDKQYLVSFKNRNNKKCQHLLIQNY